jgi:hypothetical protein
MRRNNFTTTTRSIHTTNSRFGAGNRHGQLTSSSKPTDSRKVSNLRTSESRFYTTKQVDTSKHNLITTSNKREPMSVEKQLGTVNRKTRNSTVLRNSKYQEKEYIIAIIENYAREVIFSVKILGWNFCV